MHSFTAHNPASGFLAQATRTPDRIALRLAGAQISYGELAVQAGRIAAWLLDVKDRPDMRVGILAQRSPEAYAGLLGACMAGMAYVPIGVDLPLDRQLTMIRRARLAAIVTARPLNPQLAGQIHAKVLGPAEMAALPLRPLEEARPVSPNAPAYLLFASGTPRTSKAVVVTMGNVAHFLRAVEERCLLFPEERVSQFYDLTFDLSVFNIFHGLVSGACLHGVPAPQGMAPTDFIRNEALTAGATGGCPGEWVKDLRRGTPIRDVIATISVGWTAGEEAPVGSGPPCS